MADRHRSPQIVSSPFARTSNTCRSRSGIGTDFHFPIAVFSDADNRQAAAGHFVFTASERESVTD